MTTIEIEMVIALSARATQNQVDIFIDHVLLGRTCEQLASEYGLNRARIGQISTAVRRKARRLYTQSMELAA